MAIPIVIGIHIIVAILTNRILYHRLDYRAAGAYICASGAI